MLYVVMKNSAYATSHAEHGWHLGEARPKVNVDQVDYIQADGHELEWIIERWIRLPYFSGGVSTWYGDTAKMIYASLPTTANR